MASFFCIFSFSCNLFFAFLHQRYEKSLSSSGLTDEIGFFQWRHFSAKMEAAKVTRENGDTQKKMEKESTKENFIKARVSEHCEIAALWLRKMLKILPKKWLFKKPNQIGIWKCIWNSLKNWKLNMGKTYKNSFKISMWIGPETSGEKSARKFKYHQRENNQK